MKKLIFITLLLIIAACSQAPADTSPNYKTCSSGDYNIIGDGEMISVVIGLFGDECRTEQYAVREPQEQMVLNDKDAFLCENKYVLYEFDTDGEVLLFSSVKTEGERAVFSEAGVINQSVPFCDDYRILGFNETTGVVGIQSQ